LKEPLHVFYDEQIVGRLYVDDAQRLTFRYDPLWLEYSGHFPLSLTMPCRLEPYEYPVPQIFFENLLPEDQIRRAIEQGFKLPKGSPYQFLKEFGEDLSGAFVVRKGGRHLSLDKPSDLREVPWQYVDSAIDDGRKLYQSVAKDFGAKFSLAGAQDKFVVVYDRKRDKIFVPASGQPTTHILKINVAFKNSQTVFNEFFCLTLARLVKLPVVEAELRLGGHPKLLVKRYDRVEIKKQGVARLHQEDLCQALGLASGSKYEAKGGRPLAAFYAIINEHSKRPIADLEALLSWQCFNILIGNNDAHGKNLSLLYDGTKMALAPFYDLVSTEVYRGRFDGDLAFSVNGVFDYQKLRPKDFEQEAQTLGLRKDKLLSTFQNIAQRIEKKIDIALDQLHAVAPTATIGDRISKLIRDRLKHFRKISKLLP
jgi:serine/threonine-protein kinase HipA